MDVKSILQLAEGFVKSPRGSQVLSNLKGKVTKNPENKPSIVTFVTKGRVYDQQTNESLQGVNIKPLEVLYPMKSFKNDEGKLEYKYDKDGNKEIKTDLNGEFENSFLIPLGCGQSKFEARPPRGDPRLRGELLPRGCCGADGGCGSHIRESIAGERRAHGALPALM